MKDLKLRPVGSCDEEFLIKLYASSRPDLEWITGIDEKSRYEIIYRQYLMEKGYLDSEYPMAVRSIVVYGDELVGRLYKYVSENFIRLIAISVIPEHRNRGIGTELITDILREAKNSEKTVCLSVMWFNDRARSLYEKFGFHIIENEGVRYEMQWTPFT